MSLRKPLTLTPARLEANRRSAQRSTGPRTLQGKAQSRMNGLRNGSRSRLYLDVLQALVSAPPCAADQMARAILTPELAAHPLFAELVEVARQAEMEVVMDFRGWHRQEKDLAEAEHVRIRPAPNLPYRSKQQDPEGGIAQLKKNFTGKASMYMKTLEIRAICLDKIGHFCITIGHFRLTETAFAGFCAFERPICIELQLHRGLFMETHDDGKYPFAGSVGPKGKGRQQRAGTAN